MGSVFNNDGRLLRRRMGLEIRAYEAAVPRPSVLGVGCGVNAREAAARTDEAFKRSLLRGIENVTRRGREDHAAIALEIVGGEHRGVFGCVDVVAISEEFAHAFDGVRDRIVAETRGFREDEQTLTRCGCGRRRCGSARWWW